jgi:DNA (cytosine-5)-methyltransferase 1
MNETLKLLDLFSGIGGFSLGFERTNRIKTIAFCEKDQFCKSVLKKHWSNTKIYNDVRDIKGSEIQADIISGGFPCQPFSVAGKQRGKDDDRYLWDETLRVVAETKPRWFVGENVDGIINIDNGSVLQQIQKDLEAESFEVQCLVIPASGIGAWHQRKRVWIIANSNSSLRSRRRAEQQSGANEKRKFYTEEEKQSSYDLRSETIGCDVVSSQTDTNTNGKRSQRFELQSDNLQKRDQTTNSADSCFEEQQSWWQTQSKLCGVPNGISYELDKDRANRIKSLGNSIVPEIAYLIGKSIITAEYE